jgi:hypothetical protein
VIKTDYTRLDNAILAAIKGGYKHFADIRKYVWGINDLTKPTMRTIDLRLQAMRREGKIVYTGQKTGWTVSKETEKAS